MRVVRPQTPVRQMRRGPDQTRFYFEVPASDTAADWPQPRIRDELTIFNNGGY